MNAVIFDFDGTIADSFDVVLDFLLQKAGRNLQQLSDEEREQLKHLSMKDLALKVGVPGWRLPLVYFQGKARLRRHMNTMPLFTGMDEVIKTLHAEEFRLYIISSNNKRNITRFLVQRGLSSYFIKVYGNAGWFGKAAVLRQALMQNHLQANSTVYVGDEVRDVAAAQGASMPSVAVCWGFSSEEQLLDQKPTVLVRNPKELQKTLVEWGKTV